MTYARLPLTWVALTASLLLSAALAGCGSSSTGSTDPATPSPPSAPATPPTSPPAAPVKAPTIGGTAPPSVMAGQPYSFTPTATTPNGGTLRFTVGNKPPWAEFETSTGRLSGTPAAPDVGNYTVTITVNDGTASATLTVQFAVLQAANGRTTLSWTAPTQRTDGTPLTNLAGYRVYYGRSPNELINRVEIGNATVTTTVIDNLTPGTWYFAATAVDAQGFESDFSGTASKTIG